MRLFIVYDQGQIVQVLDADNECVKWAGDYLGHCGGCDNCMLHQALFAKMRVAEIESEPFETFGDALGRIYKISGYSREQREREQVAAVRASEEPVKGDEAESEQQRRGK